MMRSLFSGVSGLKAHQTRMDVIGNNIANVNTTAYKSKSMNFSDMIYQTTQAATGPNAESNTGGTNPRQIGLGVKTAAISTSITTEGASQSTGNPFDLKLTGEAFFVVTDGTSTYYTRDGALDVDTDGNLVMSSTGYKVMGWTNRDADTGAIIQGTVSPINVMAEQAVNAAATTAVNITGILDKYDDNLDTEFGRQLNIQTYDDRGYEYNLKFGIKPVTNNIDSEKTTTNRELLYTLPAAIKLVDPSKPTFYKDATINAADQSVTGDELSATGLPSKLLAALQDEAAALDTANQGSPRNVTITINDAFLTKYNITDLGTYASFYNKDVIAHYDGGRGFMTCRDAAGTEELNLLDVEDEATLEALFGTLPTTIGGVTPLNAALANGLLVTEKTFSDGTATQYVYQTTDGNLTELDLNDADMSKILAALSSTLQSQYTTTETVSVPDKVEGNYTIELLGITDADGNEVNISSLGQTDFSLVYNTGNGDFVSVGGAGNDSFSINLSALGTNFMDISFNMSTTKNVDNGEKSTIAGLREDGYKAGIMTGVSIGTDGVITAKYSNGINVNIAQIAVATFSNAMGLENSGDNLYSTTANSGDPSYVDIKASGTGYMTSGVLEMSNVDLSQEFTTMITTQRGFQANSRTITVSDTLLEELINLKR